MAVLLGAVALWLGAAHAAGTPGERVRAATGQIISILQDPLFNRDAKWARISEVINKSFDFENMSRSVLGNTWRKATPEERREFVQFFTNYLEEVYRSKIETYTDQDVRFGKERIDGQRARVETLIVSGPTEIPVDYKMRLTDGEWLVYDVVIEGVSLVSNYRNTFTAIAQTGGMQGLLADVQRRIAKHRQQEPSAAR
jgi:phospholipid transport system substrate-binding protein